jgi:hypothetical protein
MYKLKKKMVHKFNGFNFITLISFRSVWEVKIQPRSQGLDEDPGDEGGGNLFFWG